jgi:hypothetical protein
VAAFFYSRERAGEKNNRIENAVRSAYDGRADLRFSAAETRIAQMNEKFSAALAQQNEKFSATLAQLHITLATDLARQNVDLHQILMGHIWKFYGFAAFLVAGVYYIARFVH